MKAKKSTWLPLLLLVYLMVMAYVGFLLGKGSGYVVSLKIMIFLFLKKAKHLICLATQYVYQ